jgi:hypothetical protein
MEVFYESHLCNVSICRMAKIPALQMDKKQHVIAHQSSQREEVGARQHREVNPNEFCPRSHALALQRGRYVVTTQNIAVAPLDF